MKMRATYADFLSDVSPFFYGKRIAYVDVGAYQGETFREVVSSGLKLQEAVLVEPNPESFAVLQKVARSIFSGNRLVCINEALGDEERIVKLRSAQTMTKVVSVVEDAAMSQPTDGYFRCRSRCLTEVASEMISPRIALLKIDVEGSELRVLKGGEQLFLEQLVDVVYIEAGIDPANPQQCHYRDIEDLLASYSYRLFGIYEQTNEWMQDSPALRRVNMAFMSSEFVEKNPYRLSRELYESKQTVKRLLKEKAVGEHTVPKGKGVVLSKGSGSSPGLQKDIEGSGDSFMAVDISAEVSRCAFCEDVTARLHELQGELKKHRTELERLDACKIRQDGEMLLLQAHAVRQLRTINLLENALENSREYVTRKDAEYIALRSMNDHLKTEIKSFQLQMDEWKSINAIREEKWRSLREKNERLKQEIAELKRASRKLKNALSREKERREDLQEQLRRIRKSLSWRMLRFFRLFRIKTIIERRG